MNSRKNYKTIQYFKTNVTHVLVFTTTQDGQVFSNSTAFPNVTEILFPNVTENGSRTVTELLEIQGSSSLTVIQNTSSRSSANFNYIVPSFHNSRNTFRINSENASVHFLGLVWKGISIPIVLLRIHFPKAMLEYL